MFVAVFPPNPSQALVGAIITAGHQPVPFDSLSDLGKRAPAAGFGAAIVEVHDDLGLAFGMASKLRIDQELPVLLVTDRTRTEDVAEQDGFDDFVLSPIDPTELAVRLSRIADSPAEVDEGDEILRHGDLELNTATYQATVAGEPRDLTYMEYELLRFFVENPGRVWSREQILSRVWGYDYFGGSRTVDVHVRRLRAKLGEERSSWIVTVRSVGYRFG